MRRMNMETKSLIADLAATILPPLVKTLFKDFIFTETVKNSVSNR